MKPVYLELQAFGPFAQKESVDFEVLGHNPLFLINGVTGAGKSTILDAICFALYGDTTGNERRGPDMRCDNAPPELLTQVSFDFSISDKLYRVTRVPEQARPKRSGDGFTKESHKASLWHLDGSQHGQLMVSSKVEECRQQIEQLIGLDANQFRQVMVLPQGKFREFLLASSEDREKIFSRLFQTSIYRRIEEALKQKVAVINKRKTALLTKQQESLEALNIDTQDALIDEKDKLETQIAVEETHKSELTKQVTRAHEALNAGKRLQNELQQIHQLKQQKTALLQQQETLAQWRNSLRLNKLAQNIKSIYEDHQRALSQLADAENVLKAASLKSSTSAERYKKAQSDFSKAAQGQQQVPEYQQGLTRLLEYRTKLHEIDAHRKAMHKAQSKLEQHTKALTQQTEKVEQEKNRLSQQQGEQLAIQQALDALPQLEQDLKQVNEQHALLSKASEQQQLLNALLLDIEKCRASQQQASEALATQQNVLKRSEIKWHQGQAALLASELADGEPCPVCGSDEHPDKASMTGELITKEALDAEKAKLEPLIAKEQKQQSALQAYLNKQSLAEALLQETMQRVASFPEATIDALSASKTALQQRVAASKNEQEVLQHLLSKIEKTQQALDTSTEYLSDMQTQTASLRDELTRATVLFEQVSNSVPQDLQQLEVLQQEIAALETKINTLNKAFDDAQLSHQNAKSELDKAESALNIAQSNCKNLQQALKQAHDSWQAKLHESAFDSQASFESALLSAEDEELLNTKIAQHVEENTRVTSLLEELSNRTAGQALPDIPTLEAALHECQQALEQSELQLRQLHSRHQALQLATKRLAAFAQESKEIDAEYSVIGTLADVACGNNSDRISLQRFVLGVLLDDVLIQATTRLALMSKGRYQLLRKTEGFRGAGRQGLELEVNDAYTGKSRPVSTLSGGESFIAALSLALGLSDVVQSYAGGIKLDTLFIDEGFGSLDPDALDLAISTLTDIQTSGRTIGIISHVSELKSQIPLRINVTSSVAGSHIAVSTQ